MVKGVAGSGKTTVAVRRVSFLLEHYCHENDDRILLVTYNKTLLNYIRHQFGEISRQEEDEAGLIHSDAEVDIETIDGLMYKHFQKSMNRQKKEVRFPTPPIEQRQMIKAIHELRERYPEISLLSPKNSAFLLDEVNWIIACRITDVATYQAIDRIGRASGGRGTPQKLTKNSPTRAAIFELMTWYTTLLEQEGFINFKMMNQLALEEAMHTPPKRYTHIIIDESQDLTRVQLEFLTRMHQEKPHASIMFIADNTQSIYAHAWLGKGRPYSSIGYDMSGKSRMLTKNYRTTTEISTAAYGLIEHDTVIQNNIDFVKPSLIDRNGHPPIYRFFAQSADQMAFITGEINSLLEDFSPSEICIAAREKRSIESAADGLLRAGIPCELLQKQDPDFTSETVKLITMHSIKGLEFKVIFLLDLNEGVIPNHRLADVEDEEAVDSEERKLLYVGMTRANERLYMSSVKRPSPFIRDINPSHLRMKRNAALKPFQSIPIQDYQLTSQIIDIHAREELVRQWLVRELVDTYGYPEDMIALEYPVQHFSKTGYVDIAVTISVNGQTMPYLFAEVKQFGTGITQADAQLRSYMETDASVRYGIATDGLDVRIVDRDGQECEDLPMCHPHFLPETKTNRTYMNLKNGSTYLYQTDADDASQPDIRDPDTKLFVDMSDYTPVPLIGNVAAGIPATATEAYESSLTVPGDWLISKADSFALTVTGDSMIQAGIDKGDVVIVNRQPTASNGDIVIAVTGDEATMKKFVLMGDTVLLLPENPAYEPIHMHRDDVLINGKVIGVLKQPK